MPTQNWTFKAKLIRVVDGDTIDLEIDIGLHGRRIERMRLLGINCPEMHGDARPAGLAAKDYTSKWLESLDVDWPLVISTYKSDVFGRYLAVVWRRSDGSCLNDDLVASGNAIPFMV